MKSKKAIVFIDFGDWFGLYKDGKLLFEGSEIDGTTTLRHLKIAYDFKESELPMSMSSAPENLKDVL